MKTALICKNLISIADPAFGGYHCLKMETVQNFKLSVIQLTSTRCHHPKEYPHFHSTATKV
jgi:hypothetical protein